MGTGDGINNFSIIPLSFLALFDYDVRQLCTYSNTNVYLLVVVILRICTAYFCFSDYSLASAAQQFGVGASLPSTAAAAIAAQAAQAAQAAAVAQASPTAAAQAAAVQAAAASSGGAPGKARSSMSLQLMSGR